MFFKHLSLKSSIDWLAIFVKNTVRTYFLFPFGFHSCVDANSDKQREHEVNGAEFELNCNRVERRPDEEIYQPGTVCEPRAGRCWICFNNRGFSGCNGFVISFVNISVLKVNNYSLFEQHKKFVSAFITSILTFVSRSESSLLGDVNIPKTLFFKLCNFSDLLLRNR